MKIGFACAWKRPPQKTWSGSAWRLRDALGRQAEVVDLGVDYSAVQTLMKYAHARYRHGRWESTYHWSSGRYKMLEGKLRSSPETASVDAVIEVDDLARFDVPFYPYKDLSFAVVEEYYDPVAGAPGLKGLDLNTIRRRRDRQHELWESAAGVFVMSEWLADALTKLSGLPREKVFVVYAGLNSIEDAPFAAEESAVPAGKDDGLLVDRRPAKLLFVGRDFFRKGGDIVVRALQRLRREYAPDLQLTVAGPRTWPLPGGVPEGVAFLGDRPTNDVARLYREHDLFVMPSRFEAFGIVHREALAYGVPVIGRSAFAMPEVVIPGKNGALVGSNDPEELASAIVGVLEDPEVRRYAAANAQRVREHYSWQAVARRMLDAVEGTPR